MTSDTDRQSLLQIAREAITAHVSGVPSPTPEPSAVTARPVGAFVTLHNHGELRGCIGHVEADEPLGPLVARCAVAACSSDPRFSSVAASELPDLDIELSILGPLEPVSSVDEIEIGRHGLVVEKGRRRGLLLPQVASEWNWGPNTFLAETCRKAGLPRDAWNNGARIWKFEAEVFGEDTLHRPGR